jgi:predicted nucleic acid-binding protein
MNWLLDTNVISETHKPQPSPTLMDWIGHTPLSQLHTSTVNIAELIYGAGKVDDVLKKRSLDEWIEKSVRPWFLGRILEVNENVLLRWRILMREREIQREPAPAVDLLIAAVALANNAGIATRDVRPFVACGIPVLNPWTGERFNGA